MSGKLDGKVAVISGGTSGIGAATAKLFAEEGAHVVITGRSEDKGGVLANELGDQVKYVYADVTKEEDIQRSIEGTYEDYGRLDVLFNNAGGPTAGEVGDISHAQIEYGVNLLLASVMLSTRYAVEPMKATGGGSIINNSSIAAIRYRQGNILYSVLKAALTHYTRMAGVELGPHNIRVNAISPGAIATPIFLGWFGTSKYASTRRKRAQNGETSTKSLTSDSNTKKRSRG